MAQETTVDNATENDVAPEKDTATSTAAASEKAGDGSRFARAKGVMNEKLGKTREVVGDQLGQAKERFGELKEKVGEQLGDEVSERWHEAQAKARRQAEKVKEQVRETAREQYSVRSEQLKDGYAKVQDNMSHYSNDLESFVRQNPGRAVLIAAAAGFLVGMLFRGRKHD